MDYFPYGSRFLLLSTLHFRSPMVLHNFPFSLFFLQPSPSLFFLPYKADRNIYKGTPWNWKTKTEIMEPKISPTVLLYFCLFLCFMSVLLLRFLSIPYAPYWKVLVHYKNLNIVNHSNNRSFKCNHCIKKLENYLILWRFTLSLPHKHLSCLFFIIKKKNLGATEKLMSMKSIQQKKIRKLAIFFNCRVENY